MLQLKVKKNHPQAKLPEKAYQGDAGFDLFSIEELTIEPGTQRLIDTGISVAIPEGYYGQIFDRSGNASKKNIHVIAGVIDSGYLGPLKVCISNLNRYYKHEWYSSNPNETTNKHISIGDKIAQMVILPVPQIEVIEVDNLDETERGEKGFGSSD